MFPFKKKQKWYQKLTRYLNVVQDVKILLLMLAVVMIWRGIWNLLDFYLFPSDVVFGSVMSIAFGVLILFFNDNDLSRLDDSMPE